MRFTCDGSGTSEEAVYNYLTDLGYNCTFIKNGSIDSTKMLDLLLSGIPQLMSASGETGCHMWAVDGIRLQNGAFDYHCNWGWGPNFSIGWRIGNEYSIFESGDTFPNKRKYIYINSKLK